MDAPISALETQVFVVPLDEPEADGTFTWDATTVVVVHIDAAGQRGIGWTYGSSACASVVHELLEPAVIGTSALDVPRAWEAMVRSIRNQGRPGISSMAIAAVDVAMWDLKAKLMGLPLHALLGAARDEVPVYGSGGFTSLPDDGLVSQLVAWVEAGIPRVKMKIGAGWGAGAPGDVDRVRLVRDAMGPEPELYVDANGAYDRKQAVRVAGRLEAAGVTWFEEPVSSDDLEGLRVVRAATSIDVAAGEYGYDLAYFARMGPCIDVLQADASRCAGITEWLRAAAVAASFSLPISSHCAQSLHVAAACAVPNLRHVEYFADHAHADRRLFDGVLEPIGGSLRPDPDRPGLGLDLKRPDAARFAA